MFRRIRQAEREIIPQVDGIVYVSRWARMHSRLLPEAAAVSSEVIFNFVAPLHCAPSMPEPAGCCTVGNLVLVKNHSYLLDVLAETKKSGQVLTLDIFGGDHSEVIWNGKSVHWAGHQVRLRGFRSDVRALLGLSGLRPRFVLRVVLSGDRRGDGGRPSCRGKSANSRALRPRRRRAVLASRRSGPGGGGSDGSLDSEPERLQAARSATERFHRDFDADNVASRLFHFVMGSTPGASYQAATKPLSL